MIAILHAVLDQLAHGAVQAIAGAATIALQLVLYLVLRQTWPRIRFHKLKDYGNQRVAFLIRNLDSVRYRDRLVVALEPRAAIDWVGVHAGPYCEGPPAPDPDGDGLIIAFKKVPADATFSIKVRLRPESSVRLRLADSSPLRPRSFDDKLEPRRGVRAFRHLFVRGATGLSAFAAVLLVGLYLGGDAPAWSDWPYLAAGVPLALAVFVLVVPTGGKPIVAGYLGWSGASKDWSPPEPPPVSPPPIATAAHGSRAPS